MAATEASTEVLNPGFVSVLPAETVGRFRPRPVVEEKPAKSSKKDEA